MPKPRSGALPPQIAARKDRTLILALTAYTALMDARFDSRAKIILVGDSLGMVVHGLPSTIGIITEMMILHAQAGAPGNARSMVAIDMPFGSYYERP
ncbi:3-methyl-2-oxobutanoate hydroxymethyltransferase [Paracoccus fontiphilus]|uniref:3-methyl-2-oxobutanoate hydroxymethyltransferase n=1 Tax=Paracoccus fontiphilus TaxID=1815556 RepID=A0ABV7IFW0_9RHOB|nr:3-methyl-2-oxobutanoate hydroxymethyltransferase [Paracoccus fontiphilus]